MIRTLTFGNNNSSDYGVYVSADDGVYNAPAPSLSFESVPGRNGDVIVPDYRFENIEFSYLLYVRDSFLDVSTQVKEWLLHSVITTPGYQKLIDSKYPNYYRMAVITGQMEATITAYDKAHIKVTFNSKPQKFLASGDVAQVFTGNGTISRNPSLFPSKPIIRIYGNGTLTINGCHPLVVTSDNKNEYIDFDCETGDATCGDVNANGVVQYPYSTLPVLSGARETDFIMDSTITKFEIKPRWWTV